MWNWDQMTIGKTQPTLMPVLVMPVILIFVHFKDTDLNIIKEKRNMHIMSMTKAGTYKNEYWLTGSQDGTIKIWNSKRWDLLRTFITHSESIIGICTGEDHGGIVTSLR